MRSVELFIESMIANPNKIAFPAVRCASPQVLSSGSVCTKYSTVVNYMGFYATKTPRGRFFLKTNVVAPYNTGVVGYTKKEVNR